jgi:DNA-nicking Smr family endonuclease
MSAGRSKIGRGTRTISAEEAAMWQGVTRALVPVKAKPRISARPGAAGTPVRPTAAAAMVTQPGPPRVPAAQSAPLAALDRRQARLIATGRIVIGARLDLHGCQEREARARLTAFLQAAQHQGHTTVLVITGKGAQAQEPAAFAEYARPRGVLRRSVPQWLAEADLRPLVVSFTEASPRHGGTGALYVRLRRPAAC